MKIIFEQKFMSKAFTLAEVLITLGIIGVVASITIPHLVTQIQDNQFKEAAKTAYSKASQAIEQLKQDNGGTVANFYPNTFSTSFSGYFKVAKTCIGNECEPCDSNKILLTYTTLDNKQIRNDFVSGGQQFVTADGMLWGFGNTGNHTLIVTVDVNGSNAPNIYGRDVFLFQIVNDRLLPMGAAGTTSDAWTYCRRSGAWANNQGTGCMVNVINGISY